MAKRSKEVSREIAIKTNVTKWTNAIESQTGGTKVYDVIGIVENDWSKMTPADKWSIISEFKKDKEFKLERNKKSIDTEELVHALANAKDDAEKNRLLSIAKLYSDYSKAEDEVEHAKQIFDKAKQRLADAKEAFKKLEEELDNVEI